MVKRMIILTLATFTLASCDSAPDTSSPHATPPDSPVSTVVPPGTDPEPEPLPSPSPIEPTTGLQEVRMVPWQDALVGRDDRTLTLTWWTGLPACVALDHVDIRYSSKDLTATLYEGTVPPGDQACAEIAVFASTTVELDQDVGGRRIVDGIASTDPAPIG
jgi:hypothetical protein